MSENWTVGSRRALSCPPTPPLFGELGVRRRNSLGDSLAERWMGGGTEARASQLIALAGLRIPRRCRRMHLFDALAVDGDPAALASPDAVANLKLRSGVRGGDSSCLVEH